MQQRAVGASTPHWVIPKPGERALTAGQTGSGKTTFQAWMLERLETSPIIIYDTKEEPKFETLANHDVAHSFGQVADLTTRQGTDYIIFRPPVEALADPVMLDRYLLWHYTHFRGVDVYIDELYQFHNHGVAGPGLVALYTRGRSRGITTLSATQRPAWISKFSMSEAQLFYIFFLQMEEDRIKIAKATGIEPLPNPPPFHFWAYRSGAHADPPQLMRPVNHVAAQAGYTDVRQPDPDPAEPVRPTDNIRHVWL